MSVALGKIEFRALEGFRIARAGSRDWISDKPCWETG
jgi:hypothetical protein